MELFLGAGWSLFRGILDELPAVRFVDLRPDGARDLEPFAFQQIRRDSGPVRVIGDQDERLVLGNFSEMLFEVIRLDVEEHREPTILRNFRGAANIDQQHASWCRKQRVKFSAGEYLCLGSRSSAGLLRKTHRSRKQDQQN